MREFDYIGLQLSLQQAELFVELNDMYSGSSYSIIKTYMNSEIVRYIDSTSTINSAEVIEELSKYINNNRGNTKIESDVIYWIGYIYRYWAYTYEITSKKIYSIIQTKKLRIYIMHIIH